MVRFPPANDEPFELGAGSVAVIADDENAIFVKGDPLTEVTGLHEAWIPRHAIVPQLGTLPIGARRGDVGPLVLRRWFARKKGWAP